MFEMKKGGKSSEGGDDMQSQGPMPQAEIYNLIHETINKEAFSIQIPKTWKKRFIYFAQAPLTHMQYILIPNPMSEDYPNIYPVTLTMGVIFIWGYSYLIVWWTYSLTLAFNLHFSIIPMLIYPFGISIRDNKKFVDFKLAQKVFKEEL
jgi:hypothetical protein